MPNLSGDQRLPDRVGPKPVRAARKSAFQRIRALNKEYDLIGGIVGVIALCGIVAATIWILHGLGLSGLN